MWVEILTAVPGLNFICLDVANGYSEHFVECVKRVRAAFPKHTIIAGNVVTEEMTEQLILSGARGVYARHERKRVLDIRNCHAFWVN